MSDLKKSIKDRLRVEKGFIRKKWKDRLRVALVYPNTYWIGMSNLGFQILYQILNSRDEIVAERAFLPDPGLLDIGTVLTMESQSPLKRFHLIAFSISYENDYPNLLKILKISHIPLLSSERGSPYPLIMAGGVATFINPEPIAPFIDLFYMGEAESRLNKLLDILIYNLTKKRIDKKELLKDISRELRCVYIPSLYNVYYGKDGCIKGMEPIELHLSNRVEVAKTAAEDFKITTSTICTPNTEFSNRTIVEMVRGCGWGCRFCVAGYIYRPPRRHPEDKLLEYIRETLKKRREVALLGASLSEIENLSLITHEILRQKGRFSISSIRIDSLTPELLEDILNAGQRTITVAPETGSERLRTAINKHLKDSQIFEGIERIATIGNISIKLYFMIGLPEETWEDLESIVTLIKKIRHHMIKRSKKRGTIGTIKCSINCFIPKPFTPLQWTPLEDVEILKQKQRWLKRALSKIGGVRVTFDVPKWAYIQALLSLGDRRVAHILLRVIEDSLSWKDALRESSINPDFFVYRERNLEEILPWDFLDHGIKKGFLIEEFRLYKVAEESPPCLPSKKCTRCGICSL